MLSRTANLSISLAERVAVISDPHANLRGVELCYKKIKSLGIDQILCCGDLVGYGREPNELVCGQNNTDGWNPFALKNIEWTKSVVTEDNLAYLANLPLTMTADDSCFVHGAWTDSNKYLFEQRDFFHELEHLPETLVFYGHTHMPSVFQFLLAQGKFDYRQLVPTHDSDVYVKLLEESPVMLVSFINPGSVGYPRGMSNQATFVIWERETGRVVYEFYDLF